MSNNIKEIKVCCAIIIKDDRVLITQRSEKMSLPLKWEFPGGKIEIDEEAQTALYREIREELSIDINVQKALTPVEHDYVSFKIRLIPFICYTKDEYPKLFEHAKYNWEEVSNLMKYDWAEADIPIVKEFMSIWK